jgi:hypothetical protein
MCYVEDKKRNTDIEGTKICYVGLRKGIQI